MGEKWKFMENEGQLIILMFLNDKVVRYNYRGVILYCEIEDVVFLTFI
jgi:hypothetical protein